MTGFRDDLAKFVKRTPLRMQARLLWVAAGWLVRPRRRSAAGMERWLDDMKTLSPQFNDAMPRALLADWRARRQVGGRHRKGKW
jgi:hypothetical protein